MTGRRRKHHEKRPRRADGAQPRLCQFRPELRRQALRRNPRRDFYCSNPDKSLVDRAAFLKQTAKPVAIKNLEAHDVKIRVMGDFAIIHAATSYTTPDGKAGLGPLHRLLGAAERPLARGLGACVAVKQRHRCRPGERRDPVTQSLVGQGLSVAVGSRSGAAWSWSRFRRTTCAHASNMITLRTVLPAFIAAKPSLISDSFSFAEIQSSRCKFPRM